MEVGDLRVTDELRDVARQRRLHVEQMHLVPVRGRAAGAVADDVVDGAQ